MKSGVWSPTKKNMYQTKKKQKRKQWADLKQNAIFKGHHCLLRLYSTDKTSQLIEQKKAPYPLGDSI
jgi:hypothetical protein